MEFLGDIPSTQEKRKLILVPFFTTICQKFVKKCDDFYFKRSNLNPTGLSRDDPRFWNAIVQKVVRFHVLLDALDSLFYEIKQIFIDLGLNNVFYDGLEDTLLEGTITWAPDKDIKEICIRYLNKGNIPPVRTFLLNLKSESYDTNFLVTSCIEKELILPLIQICTDKNDFTMPALSMFKSC